MESRYHYSLIDIQLENAMDKNIKNILREGVHFF